MLRPALLKNTFSKAASSHLESISRNSYVILDEDKNSLQNHINNLREMIKDAEFLSIEHRARLLKRLEAMQAELHKDRMYNFDRFYAFLGDLGPVLGKFAKDAKPLFDETRKMLRVVTKQQSGPAELPNDFEEVLIEDQTSDENAAD